MTDSAILIDSAMVLAAGRGDRLRPITDSTPKPLVTVGGISLLDRCLDRLDAAGVRHVVVNACHLREQIVASLHHRTRPEIILSLEDRPLETGGGVAKALPRFGGRPFFVINGDSLWTDTESPAPVRLAEAWDTRAMDVLLLLYPRRRMVRPAERGDFIMAPDGRLRRPAGGETAPWIYMGLSILHPRALAGPPAGAFSLNLLYDRAARAGRLYGLDHAGGWHHISTPADLAAARAAWAGPAGRLAEAV